MMKLVRTRTGQKRELDEFAEAIRPERADMPVSKADDALWARIVATRLSGVRGILSDVSPRRRRRLRWLDALISVAAAAAFVALLLPRLDRSRQDSAARPVDPTATYGVFGGLAFAQQLPADHPTLPPARVTKASTVRPLSLQYAHRSRDSAGRITSETRDQLTTSRADLRGLPAWRVVAHDTDATGSQRRVEDETLYVARADLRLLARAAHVTPYLRYDRINIAQHIAGDSLTGRMTTEGADSRGVGRPIARRLTPEFGPYITESFASVFLAGVALSRNWSGSVSLLGWAVRDNDVFVPLELRVEGEEIVQSPAGRFDCWRISIRYSGKQIWFWARKTDGIGVRVLDETQRNTIGTREILLVRG